MNVSQLIELLSEMDGEAEVRLANQPSYPMQYTLAGVSTSEDVRGESKCDDHDSYSCDECAGAPVVWLVEGSEPSDSPYAPRAIWEVAQSM